MAYDKGHDRLSKRLFITGIPTAGKSYLAQCLASEVRGIAVCLDDFRSSLVSDERYKKWVNFYSDQDEATYYAGRGPEERWRDLVAQSEALWPALLEKISSYHQETRPVIFESVNILPCLAYRDLGFPGVVLIGSSYETIFERNQKAPRWGRTKELQELEAREFFYDERPRYKVEAEKYGYPVFATPEDALPAARELLQ
jgi:hypothetical protein